MSVLHSPPRLAVIGGGPAGLMAAETACAAGVEVHLFEAKGHFSKPPSPLQPVSRHDGAHEHPAHQALVLLALSAWR